MKKHSKIQNDLRKIGNRIDKLKKEHYELTNKIFELEEKEDKLEIKIRIPGREKQLYCKLGRDLKMRAMKESEDADKRKKNNDNNNKAKVLIIERTKSSYWLVTDTGMTIYRVNIKEFEENTGQKLREGQTAEFKLVRVEK